MFNPHVKNLKKVFSNYHFMRIFQSVAHNLKYLVGLEIPIVFHNGS